MMLMDIPIASLLAYVGLVTLLVVTPGMDMALITNSTIRGGIRGAFSTMVGINAGSIIWTLCAAMGIGALVVLSPNLYNGLLFGGALYMIYIGIKEIRAGFAVPPSGLGPNSIENTPKPDYGDLFKRGFVTNVLNPKIGLFYTTFIPQFVPVDRPILRYILLFGILHNVIGFCWFMTYATILKQIFPILTKPSVRKAMFIATGVVILVVAILIIRGHLTR
jgi:threonine/homoserine/homoserine lactone efflux protein